MNEERDPILEEHLAAWRAEEDVRPPDDLVNRAWTRAVEERHREQAATGPRAWLERVFRPRVLRLRVTPVVGLAVVSALVAAVWVGRTTVTDKAGPALADAARSAASAARGEATDTDTARPEQGLPEEIPVRFVLPAKEADRVAVAGDFNDWQVDEIVLDPEEGGVFAGTVYLPPGTYSYMFVVDGERWVTDPYASNYRNDGFGQKNAVLRID